MAKINLAKALKLKNSLVNEINRTRAVFARENSRESRSTSLVDRGVTWDSAEVKRLQLIELKAKISTANVAIYPALAELEELKSLITYLTGLNTTDGQVVEHGRFGQGEPIVNKFDAFFKRENVDGLIEKYQKRIETLQDDIDAFNATTYIEA